MRAAQRFRIVAAAIAAATLCACGSSSTAPAGAQRYYVPPSPNPVASPQTVQFSVTIPPSQSQSRTQSKMRKPYYISSGTQSVSVILAAVNGLPVGGVPVTTFDVTSGSPGCAPSPGGYTCTAAVPGAVGIDAFTVTLYSGTNGSGAVLSAGTILAPIDTKTASLSITNAVSISLIPNIASLQLIVAPPQLPGGQKTDGTIAVQPLDPSGNVIFGVNGTVTLSLAGGGNAVGFGKKLKQTAKAQLYASTAFTYNGSPYVQQALTITAQLAGTEPPLTATATVPFVFPPTPTPSPTPTGLVQAIYVLNSGSNTVSVYPAAANGNATPIRTLDLTRPGESIAVDSTGQLHVGYTDGSVDTFAYNANGNDKPLHTLLGDPKSKTTIEPAVMTIGLSNELLTIGSTTVSSMNGNTGAMTYGANESGKAPPLNAWNFSQPSISLSGECTCSVAGLAMDSAGNYYVDGSLKQTLLSSAPGIYVAPATASGPSVAPSRTIPGDSTTTIPSTPFDGTVAGLGLDASGNIYESQYIGSGQTLTGAINVFAGGAGGGVTDKPPKTIIKGSDLNIVVGQGASALPVAVANGDVYAANGSTNVVIVYAQSGGNPIARITGSSTGLNAPSGIAAGLSGSSGP